MFRKVLGVVSLFMPLSVLAAAPAELTVERSIEINAPAKAVWSASRSFDALPSWHPGFAKDVIIKGQNNKVGAVRELTIKDGPSFTEELTAFDEKAKRYSYRIIDSPLPISNYKSTFKVVSTGKDTSKVVWMGTFKRKNQTDNPPDAESDAGVTKLITGVYDGGLSNLKSQLEKK